MSTNISLTRDDLKDIVATAVQAAVVAVAAPAPLTQSQEEQLQMDQKHRAETAAGKKQEIENKRWYQTNGCAHEHTKQGGGGSHCVFVRDNDVPQSPGYMYCQKCEGRFRPDEPLMRKLDPKAIFDTATFNRLLQSCVTSGAEIFE